MVYSNSLNNIVPYIYGCTCKAGIKCCVMNEKSSMSWHQRLDISLLRKIKRLVIGILETPDFRDFD